MLCSYGAALRLQAQRDPSRPALTAGDTTYSRADLDAVVDRIAAGLRASGCSQGDVVSFTGRNQADLVSLTFAIWRIGAVPFAIPWHRPDTSAAQLLALAAPKLGVDLPGSVEWAGSRTTLLELLDLAAPATDIADLLPPKLRVGSSGGSTGAPKAIVIDAPAQLDPDAALLPGMTVAGTHVLPLNITDGAGFMAAMGAVATGAHLVLMPEFEPRECIRLIEMHRADWMATTQPVLLAIEKLDPQVVGILSGLTVAHFSGHVADWLKRAWIERLGPEHVWWTYGGTDARGSVIGNGTMWLERPGVAGLPDPGACQVTIRDDDGQVVPAGTVGRICVRDLTGRRNFHYLGGREQPNLEGFESIGDVGYMDQDGYLYALDRGDDVIGTAGGSLYPNLVEGDLERHPRVRSAVVVGGENGIHAFIDSPGLQPATPSELAGLVHLDAAEAQIRFHYVDQPLRDLAGKAQRQRWRQRVGDLVE